MCQRSRPESVPYSYWRLETESAFADETRSDIEVECNRLASFQQFPAESGHRGVVGAVLLRGDQEFNSLSFGHLLKFGSQ